MRHGAYLTPVDRDTLGLVHLLQLLIRVLVWCGGEWFAFFTLYCTVTVLTLCGGLDPRRSSVYIVLLLPAYLHLQESTAAVDAAVERILQQVAPLEAAWQAELARLQSNEHRRAELAAALQVMEKRTANLQ